MATFPKTVTLFTASAMLAACSPATVTVHDNISVAPTQPQVNRTPVISGAPSPNVVVGGNYRFTPTASDPDGDVLTFSIQNKPAWASFNAATGEISGTPRLADAGTFTGIAISVSDGKATAALAGFTVAVLVSGNGTATLSWAPPTQNTDGSTLNDLGGYWVFHSTDNASLVRFQRVADPAVRSYTVTGLAPGRHYFAVAAYSTNGSESALSTIGQKDIP